MLCLIDFDEKENERFVWPDDLDQSAYGEMIDICGITPALPPERLLNNLGVLKDKRMTYAGSLLLGGNSSRLVPGKIDVQGGNEGEVGLARTEDL